MDNLPTSELLRRAASHVPLSLYSLFLFSVTSLTMVIMMRRFHFSLSIPHFRETAVEWVSSAFCSGDGNVAAEAELLPYQLLLSAALLIPPSHYCLAFLVVAIVYLYRSLGFHLLHDLHSGFRGQRVSLTVNRGSELYSSVVSRCRILHGRYLATPWLCSPNLQTFFHFIFKRSYAFCYKRELFHMPDGETVALDWLNGSDVWESTSLGTETAPEPGKNPIVIVIPGILSDSASQYIKLLVKKLGKRGWNICVANHQGLGGVEINSHCFYNAGWTGHTRKVIDHIRCKYPEAPLYAIGTSIGANILVKYLGEDGINAPLVGAAAVCCPWDCLAFDRFIRSNWVQKFYDKVLTTGLQAYTDLHHSFFNSVADCERIRKSRSFREFHCNTTCIFGKFKTADTYYRQSSSVNVVGNVAVPLLCINALDDPICPMEAIPWDECMENKNIILATTDHGGHVAHFEGATAQSMWWIRAVDEFLSVLYSSQFTSSKKNEDSSQMSSKASSTAQGLCSIIAENGKVKEARSPQSDDWVPLLHSEDYEKVVGESREWSS